MKFLSNNLSIFLLGLSYFFGVLSFQHYSPSAHDFYINAICFTMVSVAVLLLLFKDKGGFQLYLNNIFWLVILGIFVIQPLVNEIIYVDGLIFPISIVFLVFILSICISNYKNKIVVIKISN